MTRKTERPVIVRTTSAGVHFGYLESREGKEVKLVRSKRIWQWFGPESCSGLAMIGLDISKSKTEYTGTIILTEAIEIIDCTDAAVMLLEAATWKK